MSDGRRYAPYDRDRRTRLSAIDETPHDGRLFASGLGVEATVCFIQHEVQGEIVGSDGVGKGLPYRPTLHVGRGSRKAKNLLLPVGVFDVPTCQQRTLCEFLSV